MYTLLGTDPTFLGDKCPGQYWVVGRLRLSDKHARYKIFEKVSVFQMTDLKEIDRLNDLGFRISEAPVWQNSLPIIYQNIPILSTNRTTLTNKETPDESTQYFPDSIGMMGKGPFREDWQVLVDDELFGVIWLIYTMLN
ncbi:hypothetical protein F5146DRAFT_995683 [Armillaria mellea]|nr:hypothetical protein F5146DRAFT_995683 [Armillaria mellea]